MRVTTGERALKRETVALFGLTGSLVHRASIVAGDAPEALIWRDRVFRRVWTADGLGYQEIEAALVAEVDPCH